MLQWHRDLTPQNKAGQILVTLAEIFINFQDSQARVKAERERRAREDEALCKQQQTAEEEHQKKLESTTPSQPVESHHEPKPEKHGKLLLEWFFTTCCFFCQVISRRVTQDHRRVPSKLCLTYNPTMTSTLCLNSKVRFLKISEKNSFDFFYRNAARRRFCRWGATALLRPAASEQPCSASACSGLQFYYWTLEAQVLKGGMGEGPPYPLFSLTFDFLAA